jgi:hypothetical protein
MTRQSAAAIPLRVGRKKRYSEDLLGRFPAGTVARIDKLRAKGEERTQFLRDAVERELKRREAAARRRKLKKQEIIPPWGTL